MCYRREGRGEENIPSDLEHKLEVTTRLHLLQK